MALTALVCLTAMDLKLPSGDSCSLAVRLVDEPRLAQLKANKGHDCWCRCNFASRYAPESCLPASPPPSLHESNIVESWNLPACLACLKACNKRRYRQNSDAAVAAVNVQHVGMTFDRSQSSNLGWPG